MLIRIAGGTAGIKEYLESGRKEGRDLSRDELDERVILEGDLETADAIILSMDNEGERYLHITLSLKEDEVSRETLENVVADFKRFAFAAYDLEEYSFYAEAHMPRIKSYIHERTGEFVERKPHIHIVIPKINLLSGQHLNPFGMVEQNERFIDAFQEHINNKYGFASPKDHRRLEFNNASEMISRHKGNLFNGHSQSLKATILDVMLSRDIERYDDFKTLLDEYGETGIGNSGKPSEYLTVKPASASKYVRLKEFIFSRAFVELPTAEKQQRLAAELQRQYEVAGAARRDPDHITAQLDEWQQIRAREIKYLNSGNRMAYRAYRQAGLEERGRMLDEREQRFYEKHRAVDVQELDVLQEVTPVLGLNAVEPRPADRAPTPTRRQADSAVSQRARDLRESQLTRGADPDMREIKRQLDAGQLLAELSRSHGVLPEKYEVTKAKDGSDRIRCGTRNLNVSDFLTKELNLPWRDAERMLRDSFDRQIGREQQQGPRQQPGRALWAAFQAQRGDPAQQRAARWEEQLAGERARREAIRAEFRTRRSELAGDRGITPAARKAALSIARMERLVKEEALREQIRTERAQLRARKPTMEQYRDFLADLAQAGDEHALAELRRQRPAPEGKRDTDDCLMPATPQPVQDREPIHRGVAHITHQVHHNGDVTYRRAGQAMLRDEARVVYMLQTDHQAIEMGLRLAQAKFGPMLKLSGSQAFQETAARVAAEAGMKVEFTDARLNQIMRERSAQIAAAKAADIEARRLAHDFIKQRTEVPATPAAPEATKGLQEGQERPAGPAIDSKPASTDRGRYTGLVAAVDDRFVYQVHGRDTIRHERKHFSELPQPGEKLTVAYTLGNATVKNHDRQQDLAPRGKGMSR